MTDAKPIACSLGAGELEQRIAMIAQVGADGLISRDADGNRHRLHFRADPATRHRLEEIVAAEAECCAFLDLSLTEDGDKLLLSISAPEDGQAIADELARAFAG